MRRPIHRARRPRRHRCGITPTVATLFLGYWHSHRLVRVSSGARFLKGPCFLSPCASFLWKRLLGGSELKDLGYERVSTAKCYSTRRNSQRCVSSLQKAHTTATHSVSGSALRPC